MITPLFSGSSDYGTYRVIDTIFVGRPARILYGANSSPQSGLALDDDPELIFDYNQRFLEMMMSHQPDSALVIGGGTCTLPTAAHQLFPNIKIDVVEIDKLLIDLAYDFFDMPKSKRLTPVISDAYKYLQKTSARYDMIVIDAFTGYTIPPHLLQLSAILQYQKHLNPGGIVTINFIAEYKKHRSSLAHEIVAAFSEVFKYVAVYQSDPNYPNGSDQNLLLAASDNELHFDYLQSKEVGPA